MFKKYIGTKQFYQGVIYVAVPIIIQNVITNFVSLLDNIMVGQVGTEQMAAVSVANQLLFVFYCGMGGITMGASVLGSQFFGNNDNKGVAHTFKVKFILGLVFLGICMFSFTVWGDELLKLFLHESDDGLDVAATFVYAKDYMKVILTCLPLFMITQCYASTLRDIKETRLPMIAGLCAVFVNLLFNYILIYGKFGFPEMGIVGAAVATNISRVVEVGICVIWTHTHPEKLEFPKYIFKELRIPKETFRKATILALPTLVNEILWSAGMSTINQSLSMRGVAVVSATNITSVVLLVSKSVFIGMGISLAIIVGNALGSGDLELAVDSDRKMIALIFAITFVLAVICFFCAPVLPLLYNTTDGVRALATKFIRISSILMPTDCLMNAFYHTIKSGGNPLITFLYDGGYTWTIEVPFALILGHLTNMPVVPMYALVYGINYIKVAAGLIMVKKKIWVRTLVGENKEKPV